MGNSIPYSIHNEDSSESDNDCIKTNVVFLTVPSIPYPDDHPIDAPTIPQTLPDMVDVRSTIEVPYPLNHPIYMKHRANIEIIARQLECMASECGAWKGRISRVFWEEQSTRTLVSIRDIYDCVQSFGMIPFSMEQKRNDPSIRIAARPYRLLVVKQVSRSLELWQSFLSSQCPIAISLALYTNTPSCVYEPPTSRDRIHMVIPALVVGYDSRRDIFIVQAPFDTSWGEDGYIALPYECIENPSIVLEMWVAKFSKHMKRFETPEFDTVSFNVSNQTQSNPI